MPSVLNSYDYATLYNEACRNSGQQEKYLPEQIQKFRDGTDPMYPSIDYFDVYYDKASMQNHRLNLTGGSDNFQYAIMLGYLDQEGILVGTNYRKTDFRTNIDSYLWKKRLRVTTRLSGNYGVKKEPRDIWNAKWYATNAPVWPLKNEEGVWMSVNGERNYYGEIMEGSTSRTERYMFNGQLEGELKIWDGLSAQLTYGYNVESSNVNEFHANVTLANTDGSTKSLMSDLNETNHLNYQTLLTTLLKYDKKFGKHSVSAMVGYSEEYFKWKWNSGFRSGFVNNNQPILNLGDASTMSNNADAYDLGLRSYFARINYSFNDRYLFEANIRRDGSSRFAKGNQWGTFPSFSVGWLISEENFMKNLDWLDMFKIRASYGEVGNDELQGRRFPYISLVSTDDGGSYYFGEFKTNRVQAYRIKTLGTPNLTWEVAKKYDIGVDFSVLNGKFTGAVDYFVDKRDDIFMQRNQMPLTTGLADQTPMANVGKMKSYGWDGNIAYTQRIGQVNLQLRANFTYQTTDVIDRDEAANELWYKMEKGCSYMGTNWSRL